MKVIVLLAHCIHEYMKQSVQTIKHVFEELEVEVEIVDLKQLGYCEDIRIDTVDKIMHAIEKSNGVVAICSVPLLGIHATMQNFFDHATLYDQELYEKPFLAITYSDWLGEGDAANHMLKCWSILGGNEGIKFAMNKNLALEQTQQRLEKVIEDFYRLLRQDRLPVQTVERQIYIKEKQNNTYLQEQPTKVLEPKIQKFTEYIQSSELTPKEQTIKELANLLKQQSVEETDNFTKLPTGIYEKPLGISKKTISNKILQSFPHYFVAQHDKTLEMKIHYIITDLSEQGYIIIKDGDCVYKESIEEMEDVEIIIEEKILNSILQKNMTYQKAFMLGKLKVKGNFVLLPRLDQVFKKQ